MITKYTNGSTFYYDKLYDDLVKKKNLVRKSILQGVTPELATALKKDKWFMLDIGFGVGVFSDGASEEGKIMESRCYTALEQKFRDNRLTTKEIVKEFSEPYLRHYFIYQWIKDGGFKYI